MDSVVFHVVPGGRQEMGARGDRGEKLLFPRCRVGRSRRADHSGADKRENRGRRSERGEFVKLYIYY